MFLKSIFIVLALHCVVFSSSEDTLIALKLGRNSKGERMLPLAAQLESRQELLQRSIKSPFFKSEVMKESAKEFSGALQWFHKSHVFGDNVRILVFEPTKIDHQCLSCDRISQMSPDESEAQLKLEGDKKVDHATIVVSILQSIAPHAFISIMPLLKFPITNPSLVQTIEKSQIINQSLGFKHWKEALDYIEKLKIILDMGKPKLIIQSAGNSGRSLSDSYEPNVKEKKGSYQEWERFADHRALDEYLKVPKIQTAMIVVGAIDQNYEKSSFSNYPGEKESIQNHFLCVLGRDVGAMRYNTFQYVKGTSASAPIVSGAAALLMSAYPSLNTINIKEVLLESADRTFFVMGDSDSKDLHITLIYDPQGAIPDIRDLRSEGYHVEVLPFDPKIYGKGVLNLRNAREYALLKLENSPETTPQELRARMKEKLRSTEEDAAKKIQKAFREHKRSKPRPLT